MPARGGPRSLKKHIISFIFSSLCSIALLVGLAFYFAPEKSFAYFKDSVQNKIDYVTSFDFQSVLDFGACIFNEIPPMLKAEYDVLKVITENVSPALQTAAEQLVYLDYSYAIVGISLVVATAIAGYFFPLQELMAWLANVIWGSVCIVSWFLPLDSGMGVLTDKDVGMYKIAVMVCAVLLTLAANYIVILATWWVVGKALSLLFRGIKNKLFGRWKKRNNNAAPGRDNKRVEEKTEEQTIYDAGGSAQHRLNKRK